MKKVNFKSIAIGFVLGLLTAAVGAAVIAGAFTDAFRSVPKPEIREGEFDFSLTYMVDGEKKKIEGTYVCEFEGVSKALDGIGRDWNGYIKDHDNNTEYEVKTTDKGVIMINLDISPEFFMADPNYKISENTDVYKPEPYVFITSGDPTVEDPTNEVFFDYYEGDDVKIISFEYDQPIENIYR